MKPVLWNWQGGDIYTQLIFLTYICLQVYRGPGGGTTENVEESSEEFFVRNYSEIESCNEKPHDLLLVPEQFLYKEITEKVPNKSCLGSISHKLISSSWPFGRSSCIFAPIWGEKLGMAKFL